MIDIIFIQGEFSILGEFGLIYIGELINNTNKCIIKTLQNDNLKQDYLREIESMTNNISFHGINWFSPSFSSYSSCQYLLSTWYLHSIRRCISIHDLRMSEQWKSTWIFTFTTFENNRHNRFSLYSNTDCLRNDLFIGEKISS